MLRKFREEDAGGRLVAAYTGSSPAAPEVLDFLKDALSVPIFEGYGSTETGPVRAHASAQIMPAWCGIHALLPCCSLPCVQSWFSLWWQHMSILLCVACKIKQLFMQHAPYGMQPLHAFIPQERNRERTADGSAVPCARRSPWTGRWAVQ